MPIGCSAARSIPKGATTDGRTRRPGINSLLQRIGWFVLLWLAGIAAVGIVAFLIRSVLL